MMLSEIQKKFYAQIEFKIRMIIIENFTINGTNSKNYKGKKKVFQKFLDKNDNYFEK